VPQPHDRLFRQTFADPEHAAALLRACLPPAIQSAFDWSTLQLRTSEFVDDALHELRTDELYSVDDRTAVEHFAVLEHKAGNDTEAPLQMLRYDLQIAEHCRSQGQPVPPVLPVVVHHGPKPWNAPTTLRQDRGCVPHRFTDIDLIVIDLARYDEKGILALGLTDRGTATVLFLQILRTAEPGACRSMLQRWLPLLRRVRRGRDGRRALGGLLTHALEVTELTRDQVAAFAAAVGDATDKDNIMNTADRLRAEGRVEGRVEALLRLMSRRYGPLPDRITTRVRAATPQELDDWTDRILTAPTLEDLFALG
jgi:predicted transposase/invertase (TIGR01784 family)